MSAGPHLPRALLSPRVLILGAGQAGYVVARELRQAGFEGEISLVGDEPFPPYERPPLSKAILSGEAPPESAFLTSAEALASAAITWRCDRAISVDVVGRRVTFAKDGFQTYDKLVIATGGRPRALPVAGADLAGVFYVRNLADIERLRGALDRDGPVIVVGGGWIGLEVAATARKRGRHVTVLEAAAQLCPRALPGGPAEFLRVLHQDNGVRLRLGATVRAILGKDAAEAVQLADGSTISATTVIVGVGMTPNLEPFADLGITSPVGVLVDSRGRTSLPDIFAAGDVAAAEGPLGHFRRESWGNANAQAAAVAKAILGREEDSPTPPWFWSDQYDVNLQILGEPRSGDVPVMLGREETRAVSWFYLRGDQLAAVVSSNRPRDVQVARRVMHRRIAVSADRLRTPGFEVADLLTASAGAGSQ